MAGGAGVEYYFGYSLPRFTVEWLDPRKGGPLQKGAVREVAAGASVSLGAPPAGDDWLAVVRRRR